MKPIIAPFSVVEANPSCSFKGKEFATPHEKFMCKKRGSGDQRISSPAFVEILRGAANRLNDVPQREGAVQLNLRKPAYRLLRSVNDHENRASMMKPS